MKNHVKNSLTKVKNHVAANKVAYAMTFVAIASLAIQQRNQKEFDKFMTAKGINPLEFWCTEAYIELNG